MGLRFTPILMLASTLLVVINTACQSVPVVSPEYTDTSSDIGVDFDSIFISDRIPYSSRTFWTNAALVDTSPEPVLYNPTRRPHWQVGPGNHTVLMIKDGWSRGRRSTAHASHDTLYLVLPASLEPGLVLRLSPDTKTLIFDSFAGYNFRDLDHTNPTDATVTILEVNPTQITARIKVSFTTIQVSRPPRHWTDRQPRGRGGFTFLGTESFVVASDSLDAG